MCIRDSYLLLYIWRSTNEIFANATLSAKYLKNQVFHAYTFNLNSNGRLHSEYKDGYYKPAIIHKNNGHISMYCEHPFYIVSKGGVICKVEYFSTNRIQNNKPIVIYTFKC